MEEEATTMAAANKISVDAAIASFISADGIFTFKG